MLLFHALCSSRKQRLSFVHFPLHKKWCLNSLFLPDPARRLSSGFLCVTLFREGFLGRDNTLSTRALRSLAIHLKA